MSDQLVLDLTAALKAKDTALAGMEVKHENWITRAREVAADLARANGTVTADDVRSAMEAEGLYPDHYNAYGAIFRTRRFVWTGEFIVSRNVKGRGNLQRVWRLA